MKVLITGSLGLVGSEAVKFYLDRGAMVYGVDNNMREKLFGPEADVRQNAVEHINYTHYAIDIADPRMLDLMKTVTPDLIIHAAAQPSHDKAALIPLTDFSINAFATVIMLEHAKMYCPEAVFIYVSTNKVYGNIPNIYEYVEKETRYEFKQNTSLGLGDFKGFDESCGIDQCKHSLFGCSKLTGDLYAQEYGKYFGLKTGIFRCSCITGRNHAGVELHGFLSYVAKCKKDNRTYKIFGYKGKQVRDNIHAYDLVNAFDHFYNNPIAGQVYNMGGGRERSVSVLEALKHFGVPHEYIDQPRQGDHQWYITDVSKFKAYFPEWEYRYDLEKIYEDIISA